MYPMEAFWFMIMGIVDELMLDSNYIFNSRLCGLHQ